MSMKNEFKYYAFISYNHRDCKEAKGLQKKLEHYRLPVVAREEIGEDVRIRPVFRYVENLSLGDLRDQIKKELDASKYLIVICSPNSAKPNVKGEHWVNDEVERFIKLGRKEYIIPVIVDGEPNTGDDRECFPPALREAGIVGANLVKNRKRSERRNDFLKIVAKLLGLFPDQLIRHVEAEEVRRRRLKWLMLFPLLMLLLATGLFIWDSTRLVTRYYADYVDSFGLPEGIYELSKDQIAGRNFHYRFEFKGYQYGDSPHADSGGASLFGFRRKLMRVVQAGSSGFPRKVDHTEYSDRPAMQDFEYDKDNRLSKIFYGRYNGENRPPYVEKRLEFYNENAVTNGLVKFFSSKEGQLDIAYSAAASTSVKLEPGALAAKADITQHLLMRDALGRVVRRNFLNNSGAKVCDGDGIWGVEYEYDDLGRKVGEWYLSTFSGGFERRANKIGVAGRRYKYHNASIERTEYVNLQGSPVLNQHGWVVAEVVSWDERGNPLCEVYKDEKGRAMISKEGIFKCCYSYDADGNTIKLTTLGLNDELVINKYGQAGWMAEYDDRGLIVRQVYFGVDGKPILNNDGFAETCLEYDDRGLVIRQIFIGVDGKPILHKDGNAEVHQEYDQRGNEKRRSFYGVDGKPILLKDGYAGWESEYDERGRETRNVWIGVDGKPILNKNGYAEYRNEYDARGNLTKRSFFGVDGKPILHKDGFAEVRAEHDQRGNLTKVSYYGVDDKPILHKDGYSSRLVFYASNNEVVRVEFFDVEGKKVVPMAVIVSAEIIANSAAEQMGVKEGDVWCRLGAYDIARTSNIYDVTAPLQASRNTEKTLIVARKVDGGYEIHSFKFPVGLMGIRCVEKIIPDYDGLINAYEIFCEKERIKKEEKGN